LLGLEILEDVDGKAIKFQVDSETINMGEYDISQGLKHTFFLSNPNSDVIVDISDLHTVNPDSKFFSPVTEIAPLQRVQVSIEIPPVEIDEDVAISDVTLPSGNDRLKGELTWKKY